MKVAFPLLMLAAIVLSGCSTLEQSEGTGTGIGAVGGAVLGGLLTKGDARYLAVPLGAVIGGTMGHYVGKSVYQHDLAQRTQAFRDAIHDQAHTFTWQNPDTDSYGEVHKESASYRSNDVECAMFLENYAPAGQPEGPQRENICMNSRGFLPGYGPSHTSI